MNRSIAVGPVSLYFSCFCNVERNMMHYINNIQTMFPSTSMISFRARSAAAGPGLVPGQYTPVFNTDGSVPPGTTAGTARSQRNERSLRPCSFAEDPIQEQTHSGPGTSECVTVTHSSSGLIPEGRRSGFVPGHVDKKKRSKFLFRVRFHSGSA